MTIIDDTLPDAFFAGDADTGVWNDFSTVIDSDLHHLPGAELAAVLSAAQRVVARMHAVQEQVIALLAVPGKAGDPTELAAVLAEKDRAGEPAGFGMIAEVYEAAERLAGAETAAALTISPGSGVMRVADATDLVRRCPTVWRALWDGRIDRGRAMVLCRQTGVLPEHARAEVIAHLLPQASRMTRGELERWTKLAVIAVDPEAAKVRREEAVARRRLSKTRLDDGMAQFAATLPAHEVLAAWDLFDTLGHAAKGAIQDDERGINACRADAFTGLVTLLAAGHTVNLTDLIAHATGLDSHLTDGESEISSDESGTQLRDQDSALIETQAWGAGTDADTSETAAHHGNPATQSDPPGSPADNTAVTGTADPTTTDSGAGSHTTTTTCPADAGHTPITLPTKQGRPVNLTITLTLDTLAKVTDDPGWLERHGAIDADYARLIASAAQSVTLLIVNEQGTPVGASERRYRPRQSVRDKVITINPTCVFLGCPIPATHTDLDHIQEFDHANPHLGGLTNERQLAPLCRNHHNLKSHGGWRYHRNPDGMWVFTSLLGRKYYRPTPRKPHALHNILPDTPPF